MSPEITDRMLASDRLVLVVGDMTKPQFYKIATTDWTFDNGKSRKLLGLEGPLSVRFEGHDVDDFTRGRIQRIFFERTMPMMEAMEMKARKKRLEEDIEGRAKAARARLSVRNVSLG